MIRLHSLAVVVLCAPIALLSGCGYHLAGTADTIPKSVKTIAVPPFSNSTTRYKLTDRLPNMIAREFISRTRYQVVQDENQADAILSGSVVNVFAYPTTYDPASGRAAGMEMVVYLSIQLRERTTGTLLFDQGSQMFRQRYEISMNPEAYFDESTTAFDRLARDVARSVVTAVLENF